MAAGFVPLPGVVVLAAAAGFVAPAGAVVVEAAPLPVPCDAPELLTGVAAGVEAGSDTSGVGSGGSGFERMPAII